MFHRSPYGTGLTRRRGFGRRISFDAQTFFLFITLMALGGMGWGYLTSLKPIIVEFNQRPLRVYSNQTTVAGVLDDAGIPIAPEDIIFPALNAPVPTDQPIAIRSAAPISIQADGDVIARRTQSQTVGGALGEAGVILKPGDNILLDGQPIAATAPMPRIGLDDPFTLPASRTFLVHRAIPILINDNGALATFYTTAPTLGEALRQAGLIVYLGDYVSPDLGTPVLPGWQVYIQRSIPATIVVDGRTIRTRTRSSNIAGLLTQEGVELQNKDYSVPEATKPVNSGMTVQVMRVREDIITESESIAFQTVWQADRTMEIDNHEIVQAGAAGVKKRQIRIRFENGKEVRRQLDREWIDKTPVTQIIAYGTNIVTRDLTLPDGTVVQYWRKVRLLATSYTAATSGKARSNPFFGITYLGWQAGNGIVAVDPRVINLRTKMYIPNYGLAQAGDTGGAIKGRRIDLGYDEDKLVLWYKWTDTYLLTPPPSRDQITWVLPDNPRERARDSR